jgi:ATP synthase protein I
MRRFSLADDGVRTTNPKRVAAGGAMRERARRTISLMLAVQLGVTIATAAVLAGLSGERTAMSLLTGGIIGVVPNYYLAGRMFRRKPGGTPFAALCRIYTGELVKLAFIAALFVIALKLLDVSFAVVVAGYVMTVVVNWLALLFVDLGERRGAAGGDAQLRDRKMGIGQT